ncbi:Cyclin-dependent kinase 2-associated protein 2 [Melipona quadrifasciata]|uniref:Cyclin-dependent kinase 2-associated protein 2 n=1 Tax=Melipona quadrifasciata TaxID=166423 RepID=A0A0N0U7Q1_9HYME|nr:Cyclin-dependent kinase 2-associated protein 2 [Melipona quadrifasciata]
MEEFQTYFPIQNPLIVRSAGKQSKYSQLLKVIKELGRDIKLTYAGSKISIERLKLAIIKARMLIKECLMETEINLRQ